VISSDALLHVLHLNSFLWSCRINPALENIDGTDAEPLVTFPDDTPTEEREICLHSPQSIANAKDLNNAKSYLNSMDTVKFEEKRMTSASQTKVISDGFSSERVSREKLDK
jgi:hypothetical protein